MHTNDRRTSLEGSGWRTSRSSSSGTCSTTGSGRPVTIYAPESLETTWITADADVAESLDDLR
ncbi:hypothetical protein ACFQRB_08645 [Halobaculum litoreum]|uniref:Uncharacterized protein n=1 Tax=Halobaculum litoreum TaxID=3031998 RepID=A0ABD5XN05_9EURY